MKDAPGIGVIGTGKIGRDDGLRVVDAMGEPLACVMDEKPALYTWNERVTR